MIFIGVSSVSFEHRKFTLIYIFQNFITALGGEKLKLPLKKADFNFHTFHFFSWLTQFFQLQIWMKMFWEPALLKTEKTVMDSVFQKARKASLFHFHYCAIYSALFGFHDKKQCQVTSHHMNSGILINLAHHHSVCCLIKSVLWKVIKKSKKTQINQNQ